MLVCPFVSHDLTIRVLLRGINQDLATAAKERSFIFIFKGCLISHLKLLIKVRVLILMVNFYEIKHSLGTNLLIKIFLCIIWKQHKIAIM
jgi:hypothetical protein